MILTNMLIVAEIHEEIKQALQGKTSRESLIDLIKEQEFLIRRGVRDQLDFGFSHKHEVSFSLFASNGSIELATDHTDYDSYVGIDEKVNFGALLTANKDENKYKKDAQKLTSEGFVHLADYHSHPYDSRVEDRRRFKNWFEKDAKKVASKHRFPSGGDISAWVQNDTMNGYIIIASKPKPNSRLNLGSYIPIGEWHKRPYDGSGLPPLPEGHSFVKPIENNWYKETQINKSEADELKRLLRPVLTIRSTIDKMYPRIISEYYFIEVPVKIIK